MPKSSKSITKARSRSFVADNQYIQQIQQQQQQQQNYTMPNTPRSSVITSPKPTSKPTNRLSLSINKLYIGERVAVDSMGIVGTLKFLGEAQFKEGCWAGIQLDIVGSGKNDGSVKGYVIIPQPPKTFQK